MLSKKTKIILVLLVLVIGGGLAYWKWSESEKAEIELTKVDKSSSEVKVSFKMSYKGIIYNETIPYPSIWRRTKNGYQFEAISKSGSIHFLIKDKNGDVLAEKSSSINV